MRRIIYFISLVLIFVCPSCKSKYDKVPIKFERLERDIFTLDSASISTSIETLKSKYGELLDIYCSGILRISSPDDESFASDLNMFISDDNMKQTYQRSQDIFADLSNLEEDLSTGFSSFHHHFPQRKIPKCYTLISGYNQSIVVADEILAIALDKYFGKEEEIYDRLEFPHYQRETMSKEFIATDCLRVWLQTEYPYQSSEENVLSALIYQGKLVFILSKLMEEKPLANLMNFSESQLKWCVENEASMWVFMVEKKLLYEKDALKIHKMISPAPFSAIFSREAPGRAAIYVGYKIVEQYMSREDVSLEELMLNEDYADILAKSKYRP